MIETALDEIGDLGERPRLVCARPREKQLPLPGGEIVWRVRLRFAPLQGAASSGFSSASAIWRMTSRWPGHARVQTEIPVIFCRFTRCA